MKFFAALLVLWAAVLPAEDEVSTQWNRALQDIQKAKTALSTEAKKWKKRMSLDSTAQNNPEYLKHLVRNEFYKLTEPYSMVPVVKPEALIDKIGDSNWVWVDVRQPEEQSVSTLSGALAPQDFAVRYRNPKHLAGKKVLVFDTIGYRSAVYGAQLLKMGISVSVLEGGLLAWTHAGGGLVSLSADSVSSPTQNLHIYDPERNWIHPDYTAVW